MQPSGRLPDWLDPGREIRTLVSGNPDTNTAPAQLDFSPGCAPVLTHPAVSAVSAARAGADHSRKKSSHPRSRYRAKALCPCAGGAARRSMKEPVFFELKRELVLRIRATCCKT